MQLSYDVLVIGAGPAGSCAAAILKAKGYSVAIVEKETFPRFSIGESLLPQSMVFLETAGMLEDVMSAGFQVKEGAAFLNKDFYTTFDFEDKFTSGPAHTFQVKRAEFDKVLADCCQKKGVDIFYKTTVEAIHFNDQEVTLNCRDLQKDQEVIFKGQFVLDGSGFGRTLPRLLKLDKKSSFPSRRAIFGHVNIEYKDNFDRQKILITVDRDDHDVWLWTIPFSDNSCSIGVVATEEYYKRYVGLTDEEILFKIIRNTPRLAEVLKDSKFINECRTLIGYASDVTALYGDRFALLGNAGEFLDPIFSSGVTIALQSANLAADLVDKQLKKQSVDWEKDFSQKLKMGVNTFKAFVTAWYNKDLQDIIFHKNPNPKIKRMICSILAGYAWDLENPFVQQSEQRIKTLAELIRTEST